MKSKGSLAEIGVTAASKFLLVFAHPDDESVFSAGLIQQALQRGCSLKLITLTRGEAGSNRRGLRPQDDLGRVRSQELMRACRLLGSFDCRILDFPDSALSRHVDDAAEFLNREISSFTPDFLVGFEPDGITGHSDHRAASRAVLKSCGQAQELLQLIYATGHRHFSRPSGRGIELALRLTHEECRRKIQALEAHYTQFTSPGIHGWFDSDQMGTEHYFLVSSDR